MFSKTNHCLAMLRNLSFCSQTHFIYKRNFFISFHIWSCFYFQKSQIKREAVLGPNQKATGAILVLGLSPNLNAVQGPVRGPAQDQGPAPKDTRDHVLDVVLSLEVADQDQEKGLLVGQDHIPGLVIIELDLGKKPCTTIL